MQENFAIAFISCRKVNEFTSYDESNVFFSQNGWKVLKNDCWKLLNLENTTGKFFLRLTETCFVERCLIVLLILKIKYIKTYAYTYTLHKNQIVTNS